MLSQLDQRNTNKENKIDNESFTGNLLDLADLFAGETLPYNTYLLSFKLIQKEQKRNTKLVKHAAKTKGYAIQNFHGGGNTRQLICKDGKIVIPSLLQSHVIEWYHTVLCHPGHTRMEETIWQHFYWSSMREDIRQAVKKCHICQTTKQASSNFGHIPLKQNKGQPWETLCVDLIGPYKIPRKGSDKNGKKKKDLTLWCVTMIDPVTGWFEMAKIKTKSADVIANVIELTWLNRYPWPTEVVLDRGREFMAEFSKMVCNDYGVTKRSITTQNPQANGIIERIHQTIGNMIQTFCIHKTDLDKEDPWSGILGAVMFATRYTIHSKNRATPAQQVFGREAILNVKHKADWACIK
mgnify:CR=1 FL=1